MENKVWKKDEYTDYKEFFDKMNESGYFLEYKDLPDDIKELVGMACEMGWQSCYNFYTAF